MHRTDRSMIFLLAALLALPVLALAQPPGAPMGAPGDRPGPGPRDGGFHGPGFGPGHGPGYGPGYGPGGHAPLARLDFIARFLDLTEEQRQQALALREKLLEDSRALREQSRGVRADLRTELDAETPDPTRVGELTLALHQQRQELRGLAEQTLADFEALLTPEQLASFQKLRETRMEQRRDRRQRREGRRGGG